jgi:hypothetical protein
MKIWTSAANMNPDQVITELVQFGENTSEIIAEDEPFNQYENDRLEKECEAKKITCTRSLFKHRKEAMVQASVSQFNNLRIKIVDDLIELIRAIKNSCYEKHGKLKKLQSQKI